MGGPSTGPLREVFASLASIARTTVEPHLRAVLAGNDAEAIVLDLMQPLAVGRQFIGFGRKARRDEPGREGAHTQHNAPQLGAIVAHRNLFDCASHASEA